MLIFFLKKICDLFRQSHKNGFFSEFIFAIDFSQKKLKNLSLRLVPIYKKFAEFIFAISSYQTKFAEFHFATLGQNHKDKFPESIFCENFFRKNFVP